MVGWIAECLAVSDKKALFWFLLRFSHSNDDGGRRVVSQHHASQSAIERLGFGLY